jgi:hypothetical protein
MEIEKSRETSWKIQLKNRHENIEITSVEFSGEVRIIKLALLKNDQSLTIELNKEEFFNFLSLVSAFRDVVIGEEQITFNDPLLSDDNNLSNEIIEENPEMTNYEHNVSNHETKDNEAEELNPEEWDPW